MFVNKTPSLDRKWRKKKKELKVLPLHRANDGEKGRIKHRKGRKEE